MLNNLILSPHVSSEYQFHQATTGQIHFVRERTVASQERELEVCGRWLFFYIWRVFQRQEAENLIGLTLEQSPTHLPWSP